MLEYGLGVLEVVVAWLTELSANDLSIALTVSLALGFIGIACMPWIIGVRGR